MELETSLLLAGALPVPVAVAGVATSAFATAQLLAAGTVAVFGAAPTVAGCARASRFCASFPAAVNFAVPGSASDSVVATVLFAAVAAAVSDAVVGRAG